MKIAAKKTPAIDKRAVRTGAPRPIIPLYVSRKMCADGGDRRWRCTAFVRGFADDNNLLRTTVPLFKKVPRFMFLLRTAAVAVMSFIERLCGETKKKKVTRTVDVMRLRGGLSRRSVPRRYGPHLDLQLRLWLVN